MSGANYFDFYRQLKGRKPEAVTPVAGGAAAPRQALTVSQLTTQIDRAIRGGLPGNVIVRGELSSWRARSASDIVYFTLKDPNACIDCVMWPQDAQRLAFTPQQGLEVLLTGQVKVFARQGRYQLYANAMEPVGQGALELAFRQMQARLAKEGLFSPERKKPLPPYPRRICLLTSRDTAAVQDMLKVLRRFAWISLRIYHVPVQGEGAARRMAQALAHLGADQSLAIDLIILGRGGGSLEDLWEFNQEVLARAMAACPIPIITGIGHETDTSIADLVADYHAHTPTEAAQVAMAQWRAVPQQVKQLEHRLRSSAVQVFRHARQRLALAERSDIFRKPTERINLLRQLLDDRRRALGMALLQLRQQARQRLQEATMRWHQCHPRHRTVLEKQRLQSLTTRLDRAVLSDVRQRRIQLQNLETHLTAVSPTAVLRRGYSITTIKKSGQTVRNADQVKEGDRLVTRLADGTVESTVEDRTQLPLFGG